MTPKLRNRAQKDSVLHSFGGARRLHQEPPWFLLNARIATQFVDQKPGMAPLRCHPADKARFGHGLFPK